MARYCVNVTEVSYGFVEVEADSAEEACKKAEEAYHLGNVIWPSSEFATKEITKKE
jgi:hypothetical protein